MPFFRWCEILISILCREMEVDLRDLSPFIAVRYSILVHGVNCGSGFTFVVFVVRSLLLSVVGAFSSAVLLLSGRCGLRMSCMQV